MEGAKVGVVISTTRKSRFGEIPAAWVLELARGRSDIDLELIDLRSYRMPFFDEEGSPMRVPVTNDAAIRWAKKLVQMDGFIFVTAEYNHAPPAVLKNALDYAYSEFCRKPAAFVGYGGVGAARAIEQLRLICVELQMVPIRSAVHISGSDFTAVKQGGRLNDFSHLEAAGRAMLEELAWWVVRLRQARAT